MSAAFQRHRIDIRATLCLAYFLLGIGLCLIILSGVRRPVALPIAGCIAIFTVFFTVVWTRSGVLPIGELGLFYAFVVMVYSVMPLIGFLGKGMRWGPDTDFRLYNLQPGPSEVSSIGWCGALYLLSFVVGYICVRRQATIGPLYVEFEDRPSLLSLIVLVGILSMYFFFLGCFFDIESATPTESYLKMWQLPLLVAQTTSKLQEIARIANTLLLVWLFTNFRKYRVWIFAFLAYQTISTLVVMHGRTELVQYFLATGWLYHRLVKPFKFRTVLPLLFIGMCGLLAYGKAREQIYSGQRVNITTETLVASSNEFEAVFATACDLSRLKRNGSLVNIPPQLYFSDVAKLIPQQLVPFKKTNYEDWYLYTFYPRLRASGQGVAFSAIAESIVGFGIAQLVISALAVGVVFAGIHRWYARRPNSFWTTALYLWFYLYCYWSFRATTLYLLSYFCYTFAAVYLFVRCLDLWGRRFASRRYATTTSPRHVSYEQPLTIHHSGL